MVVVGIRPRHSYCGRGLGAVWVVAMILVTGSADAQPSQRRPQGQIPDLGRPTESTDEIPLFDYDQYFPGTWTFEWRTPESPFGEGGMLEGRETFGSSDDGRNYTSTIEATGPDGPFTVASTIVYLKPQQSFSRLERDSRGFDLLKVGHIGGDLGGFYTIHYESTPVVIDGAEVRIRNVTRIVSPLNFKVESRLSVDGGPWTNFGTGWWRRAEGGPDGETGVAVDADASRAATDSGTRRVSRPVAVGRDAAGAVPLAMLVGCVEADGADRFVVTRATDPTLVEDRLPEPPGADASLGTGRARLIGTLDEFGVAGYVDHKVWVKGLYIEDASENRLNLVSITRLAETCR